MTKKLMEDDGEAGWKGARVRAVVHRRPSFYRISELQRQADGLNNVLLNKSKQISPP
jgi:hypothetical protein